MKTLQAILFFFFLTCICYSQVTRLDISVVRKEGETITSVKDTSKFYYDRICNRYASFELKSDLADGIYEVYKNDTLFYSAYYSQNKKDSVWTYYFPNGKISRIVPFKNGKENGQDKSFREDGSVAWDNTYVNGQLTGTSTYYNSAGKVEIRFFYENGNKIKKEEFYSNGNLKSEDNYKDGLYHGKNSEYFESGKIKKIFFYDLDKLKRWTWYDEDGKITLDKTSD